MTLSGVLDGRGVWVRGSGIDSILHSTTKAIWKHLYPMANPESRGNYSGSFILGQGRKRT
jgi:hypothetical protein